MNQIDALKKIIREEVRAALREELPKILKENSQFQDNFRQNLKEKVNKSSVPLSLNKEASNPIKNVKFDNSNPLGKLLNETAMSMTNRDSQVFNTEGKSMGILEMQGLQSTSVGSVEDMLSSARKSSSPELVEIDTVPDFTGIMKKFKEKGAI